MEWEDWRDFFVFSCFLLRYVLIFLLLVMECGKCVRGVGDGLGTLSSTSVVPSWALF